MDRDFKPDHPYSKLLVEALHFAGPIAETHWVNHNDGYLREEPLRVLSKQETLDMVGQFHKSVYLKALSFNSDLIKVKVISEGLFHQLEEEAIASDTFISILIGSFIWLYLSVH
jgi:hypothetical protein